MKKTTSEIAVMSLPHRNWSCEAIDYMIKLSPMPGEPSGGNHFFVIIKDSFELINQAGSRKFLADIILSRHPRIPAMRMHFIFFVPDIKQPNGLTVNMFNFDRDENRQPCLKEKAVDYSANSAICTMIMF